MATFEMLDFIMISPANKLYFSLAVGQPSHIMCYVWGMVIVIVRPSSSTTLMLLVMRIFEVVDVRGDVGVVAVNSVNVDVGDGDGEVLYLML